MDVEEGKDDTKLTVDSLSKEELVLLFRKLQKKYQISEKKTEAITQKCKELMKEAITKKKESDSQEAHNASLLALLDEKQKQLAHLQHRGEQIEESDGAPQSIQCQNMVPVEDLLSLQVALSETQQVVLEWKQKHSQLLETVRESHDARTVAVQNAKDSKWEYEKSKKEWKATEERLKKDQVQAQKEVLELQRSSQKDKLGLEAELATTEAKRSTLQGALMDMEGKWRQERDLARHLESRLAEGAEELAECRRRLASGESRRNQLFQQEQELVESRALREALEGLVEQERLLKKKEARKHQAVIELEREERLREKESSEQMRDRDRAKYLAERDKYRAELEAAQGVVADYSLKVQQLQGSTEDLAQKLEQSLRDARAAAEESTVLRAKDLERIHTLEEMLKEQDSKSHDKYQRLLRELKVYRDKTTKLIDEQSIALKLKCDLVVKLEEENATGRPADRRMLELAELQARRDDQIQAQNQLILKCREQNLSQEQELKKLLEAKKFLQEQYGKLQTSRSRGEVNLDYLKHVMIRYLGNESTIQEKKALVPVIATILKFTPEELIQSNPQNGSWWGMVASLSTLGAAQKSPRKFLSTDVIPEGVMNVMEDLHSDFEGPRIDRKDPTALEGAFNDS